MKSLATYFAPMLALMPLMAKSATLPEPSTSTLASPHTQEGLDMLRKTSRGFSHVAKVAIPAVVSIRTEGERTTTPFRSLPPQEFGENDLFRHFFGLPFKAPQERVPFAGFGSGVIINATGHIVTNYHVIRDAQKIEVTLADDTKHQATLIGVDPDTDLAVIKINASELPHLPFGDSDALEIGEWVVAVGAPQMLRSTVTVGVVSAKGRSDLELYTIEEFIQSDVAINQGNSGGPLLNIDAEIIGINSAILSPDGTYMGISFAIPSSIVKTVSEQIIKQGTVRRGFMGIYLKPVTEEIAAAYGLEKSTGVVITDVMKDSPAQKAGLRFGDVILAVDGHEVRTAKSLHRILWLKEPGQKVKLAINREGKIQEVEVKLELNPDRAQVAASVETFGLELKRHMNEQTGKELLVVQSVQQGSPADKAGIRPGAILIGINRQRPQSIEEAYSLLKQAFINRKALLLIEQGRHSSFILLEAN